MDSDLTMNFSTSLTEEADFDDKSMIKIEKPRDTICLTYQKLVVPVKMRSVYWKGFGFPANENGEILTRQKIVCLFCQTAIAYNRNTSNLRMHLESKHRSKLLEMEATAVRSKKGQRQAEKRLHQSVFEIATPEENFCASAIIDGDLQVEELPYKVSTSVAMCQDPLSLESNPGLVEIVVPNLADKDYDEYADEELRSVENAVTEFLVTDLVSPCIVDGPGFKRLMSVIRPDLPAINKFKVEEQLLPQCHTVLRDAILDELSGVQSLGITLEEWTSGNKNTFITLSANIVKETNALETRVLSTMRMSSASDLNLLPLHFQDALESWCIKKERITAVVIASTQYQILAQGLHSLGLKVLPCLVFTLQQAISKCFQVDCISSLITLCHTIGSFLRPVLKSELEDNTANKANCSSFWLTTFNMFNQFLEKEKVIKSLNEVQTNNIALSDADWSAIASIVNVLQPFVVILDSLLEEKMPSITLIRPFICQMLNSQLKDTDSDDKVTKIMKLILRNDLAGAYSDVGTDLLLKMATYLDPRFKSLPILQDKDPDLITENIKKTIENMIEENLCNDAASSDQKSRPSGIGLLFGSITPSKGYLSKAERARLELMQYHSQPAASLDVCPVQWWSATKSRCPNLYQLNRHYSCVPASSVPSHLLTVNKRAHFCMHRAGISTNNLDRMLLLHSNQKLFSFQD